MRSLAALLFLATTLSAATPVDVESLLDGEPVVVATALSSDDALTRTAAARVALVRNLPLAEELRAALAKENDPTAAREQIRALALLGTEPADLLAEAKRLPPNLDSDLAMAVARGGVSPAIALFGRHRGELRIQPNWSEYFTLALWNRPQALTMTASPVLGSGDTEAWNAMTNVALKSGLALASGILMAAIGSESEDIRTTSLWFLVSSACTRAYEILARLSLANPSEIRTPKTTGNLVFLHNGKRMCLDEDAPSNRKSQGVSRMGGEIRAPVVKRRVEPIFPRSARSTMGSHTSVTVIMESVISKTGCVRSVNLLSQAPYPELNAAALLAISQWEFAPGMLDGEPVDVLFNLQMVFKVGS